MGSLFLQPLASRTSRLSSFEQARTIFKQSALHGTFTTYVYGSGHQAFGSEYNFPAPITSVWMEASGFLQLLNALAIFIFLSFATPLLIPARDVCKNKIRSKARKLETRTRRGGGGVSWATKPFRRRAAAGGPARCKLLSLYRQRDRTHWGLCGLIRAEELCLSAPEVVNPYHGLSGRPVFLFALGLSRNDFLRSLSCLPLPFCDILRRFSSAMPSTFRLLWWMCLRVGSRDLKPTDSGAAPLKK